MRYRKIVRYVTVCVPIVSMLYLAYVESSFFWKCFVVVFSYYIGYNVGVYLKVLSKSRCIICGKELDEYEECEQECLCYGCFDEALDL